MLMRRLETKADNRRHRASGFSLVEMAITMAILIITAVVSVISLVPMVNAQHVTNAYNTTLAALRQARDCSVSQRTSYQVTFNQVAGYASNIAVTGTLAFAGDPCAVTYQYPTDVFFLVPPAGTAGPDGYGTGTNAVDFGYTASSSSGGATTIYFCPDGSAQTASTCNGYGNWDGGVVYLGQNGNVGSFRAVDLWGGTGRVHGWRLYPNGGTYQWLRQ